MTGLAASAPVVLATKFHNHHDHDDADDDDDVHHHDDDVHHHDHQHAQEFVGMQKKHFERIRAWLSR